MRHLLLLACSLFLTPALAQNTDACYAVTTAGDTLSLPASTWIAVDRHPQLLVYKDASGKKHKEPASNFLVVRVPSAARAFARRDGPDFVARPIPTREGPDCWHFVQELFRSDTTRVYRSVHCWRCQTLRLYVQRGDGRMELMGKHNRDRVLQELGQYPAIVEESRRSNYDAVRLERVLWRMRQ